VTDSTPAPGKEVARVGTYARSSLTEKQQYAQALASAGDLVPKTFWTKPNGQRDANGNVIMPRPNPGAVLYMLETAAMLGVNPMVGLTNIHIIEGKPSLSANLQSALVREAGHRLRVWVDKDTAICEIVRNDDPEFTFRVEWGDAEMKAAKLENKDNWVKYRRSMTKARAITECIREAGPEVLMGATYSPDELGATTDEMGEPIDLQQVPVAPMPDVSRETPRAEAPIVDEPVADTGEFDWVGAAAAAASADEALALYRRAGAEGKLDMEITVGKATRALGPFIVEIGQALRDAEAAADAAFEGDGEPAAEGAAAVLDDDVVVAEIVEDDPVAEPKPRASRARKPSPEQEEAMAADEAEASN
jgi:hypothetical protein